MIRKKIKQISVNRKQYIIMYESTLGHNEWTIGKIHYYSIIFCDHLLREHLIGDTDSILEAEILFIKSVEKYNISIIKI